MLRLFAPSMLTEPFTEVHLPPLQSLIWMRTLLVVLCVAALSSPWVIYRRNHKKKLICKVSNMFDFLNITYRLKTSLIDNNANQKMIQEDPSASNGTSLEESSAEESTPLSRLRRDIALDPVHRQPIIYLGVSLRQDVHFLASVLWPDALLGLTISVFVCVEFCWIH